MRCPYLVVGKGHEQHHGVWTRSSSSVLLGLIPTALLTMSGGQLPFVGPALAEARLLTPSTAQRFAPHLVLIKPPLGSAHLDNRAPCSL